MSRTGPAFCPLLAEGGADFPISICLVSGHSNTEPDSDQVGCSLVVNSKNLELRSYRDCYNYHILNLKTSNYLFFLSATKTY